MNISLNGCGETAATFETTGTVKTGTPVKIAGNGIVGPCADGEAFCGMALNVRGGYAAVQLHGYVRFSYSGTAPDVGYQTLTAAADGKIKVNADGGRSLLVTDVDTAAALCGVLL